jgi:hypothetical protein
MALLPVDVRPISGAPPLCATSPATRPGVAATLLRFRLEATGRAPAGRALLVVATRRRSEERNRQRREGGEGVGFIGRGRGRAPI